MSDWQTPAALLVVALAALLLVRQPLTDLWTRLRKPEAANGCQCGAKSKGGCH